MAISNVSNKTKELDKKKQDNKSVSKLQNISIKNTISFLISIVLTISLITIYFIFGSIVLYECKLAQSNIVPTNLDCYPYTNTYPELKPILTNIFISNTDPPESVKLSFPFNESNSKNSLLEMFYKYKEGPNANFFVNYIIRILEGLINFNNTSITIFFNLLNKIPEILIILLGPIISLFYFIITPIVGIFVFIYYYFIEMKWFFKTNTNTDGNDKPIWKDINLLNPIGYASAFFLVFIFFILFWFILFTTVPVMTILLFYICLFMTFGYVGEINNKSTTLGTIIKETFKNYKSTISSILVLFILLSTFTNFGVITGIFGLFTVLLIYFNFIKLDIFENHKPSNLSPLTSFNQADKKCPLGKSKTFMSKVGDFLNDMKGGGIGKELKKISKKLSINQ